MAATLTARFFRRPSNPGVVVVRRDADGYRWDFTNTVFSATPALDYLAPTEDSTFPGMYLFQVANQAWDGLYQIFHYVSSAKAGTPLVLSINLTAGVQDSLYGDLAESVRLELDANSVQLAAILEDTGTTLPASLTASIANTADAVADLTIDSGMTLQNAMKLVLAAAAGKVSGASGTTVTIRDTSDTYNRIVATVDADGNRSALTYVTT